MYCAKSIPTHPDKDCGGAPQLFTLTLRLIMGHKEIVTDTLTKMMVTQLNGLGAVPLQLAAHSHPHSLSG